MSISRICFIRKCGSEIVCNGLLNEDEYKESFEFFICIRISRLPHWVFGYLPKSEVLHKFVFIELAPYCLGCSIVIWGGFYFLLLHFVLRVVLMTRVPSKNNNNNKKNQKYKSKQKRINIFRKFHQDIDS